MGNIEKACGLMDYEFCGVSIFLELRGDDQRIEC